MKSFLEHLHETQEFTSAATSQSQVAKGLGVLAKKNLLKPGSVNVDLGGGRYDHGTKFMESHGVTSHVLDPYNRSDEHNQRVARDVRQQGGADSVTVFNVLNTIKEPHVHTQVLETAKGHLKPGGSLWLSVYTGDRSGVGKRTKADSWQRNESLHKYLETVRGVFSNATTRHGMIHATND
jgi:hypothetical protein